MTIPEGMQEKLLQFLTVVVPALIGWIVRVYRKWRATRAELYVLRKAADQASKTLDAVRSELWKLAKADPSAEGVWLRHEVDEAREVLWVATGHRSKRGLSEEDVVRIIKQTQSVKTDQSAKTDAAGVK